MSAPEPPDGSVTVTDADRAERLARQVRGMTRQLEMRITAQEQLGHRLAEAEQEIDGLRGQLDQANAEIAALRAEHDRLMHTKTMRLARVPRAVYGRLVRGN